MHWGQNHSVRNIEHSPTSSGPPSSVPHLILLVLLAVLKVLRLHLHAKAVHDVLRRQLDLLRRRHDLAPAGQAEHAAHQRRLAPHRDGLVVAVVAAARRILQALEQHRLQVLLVEVLVQHG